eukprot:2364402-Rhodomonas_salina.2
MLLPDFTARFALLIPPIKYNVPTWLRRCYAPTRIAILTPVPCPYACSVHVFIAAPVPHACRHTASTEAHARGQGMSEQTVVNDMIQKLGGRTDEYRVGLTKVPNHLLQRRGTETREVLLRRGDMIVVGACAVRRRMRLRLAALYVCRGLSLMLCVACCGRQTACDTDRQTETGKQTDRQTDRQRGEMSCNVGCTRMCGVRLHVLRQLKARCTQVFLKRALHEKLEEDRSKLLVRHSYLPMHTPLSSSYCTPYPPMHTLHEIPYPPMHTIQASRAELSSLLLDCYTECGIDIGYDATWCAMPSQDMVLPASGMWY